MSNHLTISILVMDAVYYNVTGVYGFFNWGGLHNFIQSFGENEAPYEIKKKGEEYAQQKKYNDHTINMKITLREIPDEYQYNDTDSPPFKLSGYYDVETIEVTDIFPLPDVIHQ